MAVIVFDADDTLWMNGWQYDQAYVKFLDYLLKIFGDKTPNFHYLQARFFQIDGELYKKYGIRRGRVTEAMLQTYREVCAWSEWRFGFKFTPKQNQRHEAQIRLLGDKPFNFRKLKWLAEAWELFTELSRAATHKLCLLTSYDTEIWPEKSKYLGIYNFFKPENVRAINSQKTKDDFIAVSGWTPENDKKEGCWIAIGNGESDIRPALEISENWYGYYIPHGTTSKYLEHEKGLNDYPEPINHYMPPKFDHPRVKTLKNFNELRKLLWQTNSS